jgi:predicted amino acid dehydrogenase
LAAADAIATASSATNAFIESRHLKRRSIVVDSSRPANVSADVRAERPDVAWMEGGMIKLPGTPQLDVFAGPQPDRTYACVAEAMLWALEPSVRSQTASVVLEPSRIEQLLDLAKRHGFHVV